MIWNTAREKSTSKYWHRIHETNDEEPEDIVLNLTKLMEIDLTYEYVDITHRLNKGRRAPPRPTFVRFSNYYRKEQMYRGRWKLRKKSGLKGLGVDPPPPKKKKLSKRELKCLNGPPIKKRKRT